MNPIYQEMYRREKVPSFPIEKKPIGYATASEDVLKHLPTPARTYVNGADTKVPEGYTVEPVMLGLSLPTDITVAPDGTLFISEGGSSWPTRPYMPARIIRMKPTGEVDTIQMDIEAGPEELRTKMKRYISLLKAAILHELSNTTFAQNN